MAWVPDSAASPVTWAPGSGASSVAWTSPSGETETWLPETGILVVTSAGLPVVNTDGALLTATGA